MNKDKRIRIFIGHYGSGKTEFSINYAVKLADEGKKVAFVDLDIVNVYFRGREKAEVLEEMGIKVIGGSIDANATDLPSVPGEVATPLQDSSYEAVLDVGGNPVGARALGRYHSYFKEGQYDMFFVLNGNRPETQTVEQVLEYIVKIQDVARVKVTGIVNNTHLLKSTSVEDVVRGYNLALKVSEKTGLPIKYNACLETLVDNLPEEVKDNVFPIKLFMRDEWMY